MTKLKASKGRKVFLRRQETANDLRGCYIPLNPSNKDKERPREMPEDIGLRVYGCAEKYLSTKVQTNVGEQCQVGAKAHHPVDDDVNYLEVRGIMQAHVLLHCP